MSLVNLNGKLLNEAKAAISINNRSFRYGDGCFETIRINQGKIPLWRYHYERLFTSLSTLQFVLPSYFTSSFLLEKIVALAQKNSHQQAGRIRFTVFRGNGGLYDPENHFPHYLIQTWSLEDLPPTLNTNGLVTGLYQAGMKAADAFANIKSNNYLLYAMAALHVKQAQWNDALVLNHRGSIADSTIANLFVMKGNTIQTPPLTDGPVNGTMRRYLLENIHLMNYEVKEQSITAEDLQNADEVFLTNAVSGIKWVKQFEEKEYGCYHSAMIYRQLVQPLFT